MTLRFPLLPVTLVVLLACGSADNEQAGSAPSPRSASASTTATARTSATARASATATATTSASVTASAVASVPSGQSSASAAASIQSDWAELPMVAVWQQSSHPEISPPGAPPPRIGPALRFAVWSSGRVVFAKDPTTWDGPLLEGKLPESALKTLSDSLTKTAVFDLRGTTYLVPDAPVLVTLVRLGGREQILYWDEVEAPNYGINAHLKPHHIDFKKAWRAVTEAVKASLPATTKPYSGAFAPPPTWYIRPAIQSE